MGLWAHRRRHHSRSGWYSMSWVWRARPRPTAAGALPGPTLVEDVEVRMTASNFHLQLWPADAGVEAHGYARERPGPHFDVKLSSPRCRAALRVLRPEHVGTRFERHPKPTFRVALSLSHDLPRARSHDRDPRLQRLLRAWRRVVQDWAALINHGHTNDPRGGSCRPRVLSATKEHRSSSGDHGSGHEDSHTLWTDPITRGFPGLRAPARPWALESSRIAHVRFRVHAVEGI